jgi:hypothetical protein
MARRQTPEQAARFERFCELLLNDPWARAHRAAIAAGYTRRMAKSKSHKLAARAWARPGLRAKWHELHVAPQERRWAEFERQEESRLDAVVAQAIARFRK